MQEPHPMIADMGPPVGPYIIPMDEGHDPDYDRLSESGTDPTATDSRFPAPPIPPPDYPAFDVQEG